MSEQRDCSETGYFSRCLHIWNEYSAFGMDSTYGLCSIGISVESPLRSKADSGTKPKTTGVAIMPKSPSPLKWPNPQ